MSFSLEKLDLIRKNPFSAVNFFAFEEIFVFLHCLSTNCETLSVLSKLSDDVEMLLMYLSTTSSVRIKGKLFKHLKGPLVNTWRRKNLLPKCLVYCYDGKYYQKEFKSKCPCTRSDHC